MSTTLTNGAGQTATMTLTQEVWEKSFESSDFSWSFGPLTITASVDLSVPSVTASATLVGVSIGSITLDPKHPTLSIGGSVLGFGAEVTFTVDFSAKTLTIEAKVESPFGSKKGGTVIHF